MSQSKVKGNKRFVKTSALRANRGFMQNPPLWGIDNGVDMVYKSDTKMKKRTFERKLYARAGSYEVSTPDGGLESLEAEFLNISSGGVCIRTRKAHRPGSVLMLRLDIQEAGIQVPCIAEVRWAEEENSLYKVGLQFLS